MRKINLCIALCVLSVCFFLSGCQTGQVKTAAPEVLAEFDFSIKDGIILLPVKFEGEEYKFVLDTGAAKITFDDIIKRKLGKPIATSKGNSPFNKDKIVTIEFFEAQDVYLGPLNLISSNLVPVIDLDQLVEGSSSICNGVIGMDFLEQYIVQIDFDNEKVTFYQGREDFDFLSFLKPKENKHPDWGVPVKLVSKPDYYNLKFIKGKILEKIQTDFMIDTGCAFPGILQDELFDEVNSNLDITKNETLFINKIPDNNSLCPVIKTDRFSAGSFNYKEMFFLKKRMSILGLPFFSHHLVTFDFPNNTMYLKKGERFGKQFGYNSGFKGIDFILSLSEGHLFVINVDVNGIAEEKGIKQNDVVTKIQVNDKVLTSFDIADFIEFLTKLPKSEDRTYIFTFKRGDEIFTVEFPKPEIEQNRN